jgi:putative DeoR family transcriptional regulator (stage III sporulation protein D)
MRKSNREYLDERACDEALYIVENNATVRDTAKRFGISKSSVHKDVSERLRYVNPVLHRSVRGVLGQNLAERHIRGGRATQQKYLSV